MVTEKRLRTYLTRDEVTQVLRAAKNSRHGPRNFGMILLAYRHGLRASELVSLRWSDVDLQRGTIYCRRAKESRSSVHPLKRDEAAALDRILRASRTHGGDYVFHSERGKRMSRSAFWRVVAQAGERAGLPVRAGPMPARKFATRTLGRVTRGYAARRPACRESKTEITSGICLALSKK